MDKQNLMPQAAQPVNRTTTGHQPTELAEQSEETLSQIGAAASSSFSILSSEKYPSAVILQLFDSLWLMED